MTTAISERKSIHIQLPIGIYEKLNKLSKNKAIPSMRKFCADVISYQVDEMEKQQKIKLLRKAGNDPEFLARCAEVQEDFKHIDYPALGGNDEW